MGEDPTRDLEPMEGTALHKWALLLGKWKFRNGNLMTNLACSGQSPFSRNIMVFNLKLRGFVPRANYIDRTKAACWRS
jgi:hypothetical protein